MLAVAETIAAFRNVGIDPHVSLVFGFDGDTCETIDRTIDEMISHQVHLLYAFLLTPLSGTELHEQMDPGTAKQIRLLGKGNTTIEVYHNGKLVKQKLFAVAEAETE